LAVKSLVSKEIEEKLFFLSGAKNRREAAKMLGVSYHIIMNWRHGTSEPSITQLQEIMGRLGCDWSDIFTPEPTAPPAAAPLTAAQRTVLDGAARAIAHMTRVQLHALQDPEYAAEYARDYLNELGAIRREETPPSPDPDPEEGTDAPAGRHRPQPHETA